MKQFFKFVLATIVGFFATMMIIFFIFFVIIAGSVALISMDKEVETQSGSILYLKLNYLIDERTSANPLDEFDFMTLRAKRYLGLNDILDNIKKAKSDDDIKGIYLSLDLFAAGFATVEAIRDALIDFKSSGKFIISYGNIITQKAYYLASVSDSIFVTPTGGIAFSGLSSEKMYLKKMLDKLDIQVQIFHYGEYKSAIEIFSRKDMSDADREQTAAYVQSIYQHMLSNISASKDIPVARLDNIAGNLLVRNTEDAQKYGLIDNLYYKDQVDDVLRTMVGLEKDEKLPFITLNKYNRVKHAGKKYNKDKIAVIYAVGEIRGGENTTGIVGAETTAKAIREARKNDKVKAIVLRVNSPGGSGLASDIIWRETVLAQQEKPLIVSMGDLAASGGYYISCAADTIVAEPNTITGSIGVFGILPNMQKFFDNKLGITFDRVKTGKFSDLGSISRPVTKAEANIIQKEIDNFYEDFVNKVADGRNNSFEAIHKIAGGRVWTGLQAKEIGLVDVIGGLDEAVHIASTKAGIEEYNILEYPKQKEPLQIIYEDLIGETKTYFLKRELGAAYGYYMQMQSILQAKGVVARMPYDIVIY